MSGTARQKTPKQGDESCQEQDRRRGEPQDERYQGHRDEGHQRHQDEEHQEHQEEEHQGHQDEEHQRYQKHQDEKHQEHQDEENQGHQDEEYQGYQDEEHQEHQDERHQEHQDEEYQGHQDEEYQGYQDEEHQGHQEERHHIHQNEEHQGHQNEAHQGYQNEEHLEEQDHRQQGQLDDQNQEHQDDEHQEQQEEQHQTSRTDSTMDVEGASDPVQNHGNTVVLSDADPQSYNSSVAGTSEGHYSEVYENGPPVYGNSETVSYSVTSSQPKVPPQLSQARSKSTSSLAVGVSQGARRRAERERGADRRLNTVARAASHPPDIMGETDSHDSQQVATKRSRNWRRVISSAGSWLKDKVNIKVTMAPSSSKSVSGEQTNSRRQTSQRFSIQRPTLGEFHGSTLSLSTEHTYQEPIYASVLPRQRTRNTADASDSPSSSAARASPQTPDDPDTGESWSLDAALPPLPGVSVPTSAVALRPLPDICADFASESECEWRECPHLHVCTQWLIGRCPMLRRCPRPHSLRTAHNLTVLRAGHWRPEERRELRRWLFYQARCELLEAARLPPVCVDHARGVCGAQPCDALHVCPRFLTDMCTEKLCPLGHDLLEDNNRRILTQHGHDNVYVRDLLHSIRSSMTPPPRLL